MGEQSPLQGQSSLPGQTSLQAQSLLQSSALPSSRGSGPRIYVGGIPTAVSETMIRQHFSQWGQVGANTHLSLMLSSSLHFYPSVPEGRVTHLAVSAGLLFAVMTDCASR